MLVYSVYTLDRFRLIKNFKAAKDMVIELQLCIYIMEGFYCYSTED